MWYDLFVLCYAPKALLVCLLLENNNKKWKIIAPKNNVILSKLFSSHWASLLFGTAFKVEVVSLLLMSTYEAFFGSLFQAWKFITTIISDSNTHIYSFSNQLCMQFRCAKIPPKSWTYSILRCFLFRSHCIAKSTSTDRTVTLWCQIRTARSLLGTVV